LFHKRSAALVTALVTAVVFPALTASSASARTVIPWSAQTVYALGPGNSYVAEWLGPSQGWIEIGGPAAWIYAGTAGVFATNPSTGDIYAYNGTPGSWTEIGGPGSEFAEGGGHLYGLAPDDSYVAEWNGPSVGGWTIIGGPAGAIMAGGDGLVAVVSSGDAAHYNGTPGSWSVISGPGNDFVVGTNTVYRLSQDQQDISVWTGGTSWTPIWSTTTGTATDLFAGGAGVYLDYEANTAATYQSFEYDNTPNQWSMIGTGSVGTPGPIAESATHLYGMTGDGGGSTATVDVYSGSGTAWTVIGGPADNLAAGD
jgi:hypothetical protein